MKGRTRGRDFARSFEEIAAELGTTRQNVELIFKGAVAKLQARARAGFPLLEGLRDCLPEPEFIPQRKRTGSVRTPTPLPSETSYPDWLPETTVVVSGPLGGYRFPGRPFPSRRAAREYWLARAGRIYEEFAVPGRYIFRVKRGTTWSN